MSKAEGVKDKSNFGTGKDKPLPKNSQFNAGIALPSFSDRLPGKGDLGTLPEGGGARRQGNVGTGTTDHRDIGRELDLFSFHEITPGAPFWHAKGMIIFKELEKVAREMNERDGYQEISTPIMVKKEVFEKSGHWEHYRENMFYFDNPRDENETLIIKPMNCPESTYIYNSHIRSYRDLPLRLAEIGRLHRNELSGTLGGMLRVRQMTMDDAHIYLRPDQVEGEVVKILNTIKNFYALFGFATEYALATQPKDSLGGEQEKKTARSALEAALKKTKVKYALAEGEGVFYGPKIEAHLKDSQDRDWQLGTAQLDLVMLPKQFDVAYTDENGKRQMPWVIHRAIFGSFERFVAVLLEHTQGKLPLWLSPVQIVVLAVSDEQKDYALEVVKRFKAAGIRVEIDISNDTINKKIREAELERVPYILVVGEKEEAGGTVAVRRRGQGDQGQVKLEKFLEDIKREITDRK